MACLDIPWSPIKLIKPAGLFNKAIELTEEVPPTPNTNPSPTPLPLHPYPCPYPYP